MNIKNVLYVVAHEGENKIMTTENYYPIPPTKTQKAIICLPEEVQAWKDENQKLSTRVEKLEAQVAALQKIAEEERARALWFVGDDPAKPPNLDWEISPNEISEKVKSLWRNPARRQLAKEHPEVDWK